MQKRKGDFGKKGQSKYKHLTAEDTTNFDPLTRADESILNNWKKKMAGYKGYGNSNIWYTWSSLFLLIIVFIFLANCVFSHLPVYKISFYYLFYLGMFKSDHELYCSDYIAYSHILPYFDSVDPLCHFHFNIEQNFIAI